MMTTQKCLFLLLIGSTLCARSAAADTLFDNGPAVATGEAYNFGLPDWAVFDDFTLSTASIITGFDYDVVEGDSSPSYQSTEFSILDGFGGNVLASGERVAFRSLNG